MMGFIGRVITGIFAALLVTFAGVIMLALAWVIAAIVIAAMAVVIVVAVVATVLMLVILPFAGFMIPFKNSSSAAKFAALRERIEKARNK
jgi:hypothetical protein